MKIANGFWLATLLFFGCLIAGFAWLLAIDYETVLDEATHQLKRPDLKIIIRNKYFTQAKFDALQRAALSLIPILLAIIGFFLVKRQAIVQSIHQIHRAVITAIKNAFVEITNCSRIAKLTLISLIVIILIRSVYYAYTFYPQYDECWNYNYFLSNHFFTTFFAYNNYPFHNVVTNITLSILPNNTFCMRLPNIIIGLINMLLVFVIIKKLFKSERMSIAACALFAVLPTVVFYMLFARGVMLSLFFAILLSYYFFIRKVTHWSKSDVLIVIVLGGLGSFSMISFPIFIVVLITLFCISTLLKKDYKNFKKLFISGIGIGALTLLLYAPIFMGSGADIGLDSAYLTNDTNIISRALTVSRNQIGYSMGAYFFILANLILLFLSRRKELIIFNLLLLLLPFILPSILGSLPARALGFQALAYLFTLCLLLHYLTSWKPLFVPLVTALVLFLNYTSIHHTFFDWSKRKDKGAYKMAQVLIGNNVKSLYDLEGNFSYFVPSLQYHYKLSKQELKFYTANKKSARYLQKDQFMGVYYVSDSSHSANTSHQKILYEYLDESNHFILYKKEGMP